MPETDTKVHALSQGMPLCRFSVEAPGDWPSGHIYTEIDDLANINCVDCKREAEGIALRQGVKRQVAGILE